VASSSARRRSGQRSRPWLGWLSLLVVALVLVAGTGPRLGTFLIVSDSPAPADATFLTYGVSIRRAALDAAIRGYQRAEAPRVLVSTLWGRDAEFYIVPNTSELARQYLLAGGVPAEAIAMLAPVNSELEEAQRLRDAVAGQDWKRVVAYAPDFRSRRTAGTLKHALAGTGVELRLVAVRDPEVQLERWWTTRPGIETIYNEYPKLAYYFLRGRL
jgi:uncharacterized SAM-binding protein YcdF (DUF218 family)